MKLFDLHCDTPFEMHSRGEELYKNSLHISLEKANATYGRYVQIMDIWSNRRLSDEECYSRFFEVYNYFKSKVDHCPETTLVTSLSDTNSKSTIFLGVEDARLLSGDLSRLDKLYECGVRFLTLLWGGETCIGGSHDTKVGLTQFGKDVARRCFELGVIPDISHASEKSTYDMIEISQEYGKPLIATHSNSKSVCDHSRNLSDDLFRSVNSIGGIVGISLCPAHLNNNADEASFLDVLRHTEHYLSLGGERSVAFGCDFDGTDLPSDISGVDGIIRLAYEMQKIGYSDELINNIFYNNAYNFVNKNLR